MTQVPDRVLQWLHNTLKPQYHFVDRTYSDVAQCLTRHSSLSPKTDVHTFDNGSSALLLSIHGILPTHFRGVEYRYPITLWIPHAYPREAPMAYVSPTQEMSVRTGQHVSADGRIYHPYLAQWANYWDRSNLVNFLQILADVFAKEPPVLSRQQQPQRQYDSTPKSWHSDSPGPRRSTQTQQPLPPPKPPKSAATKAESAYQSPPSPRANQRRSLAGAPTAPPALPPKPGLAESGDYHSTGGSQHHRYAAPQNDDARGRGPPLPPLPPNIPGPYAGQTFNANGARASQYDGMSQQHRTPPGIAGPAQFPAQQSYHDRMQLPQSQSQYRAGPAQMPPPTMIRQQQPPLAKAPQDLMSTPLEVTLPSQHNNQMPAPPIPPNPEKDALLRAISQGLIGQLTQTTTQNYAAIAPLEAQNAGMQQAYRNLSNEVSQLQDLDKMLTWNEKILHETMREADKQLDSVGRKEKPKVDEVLVAPTVVGEQLYGAVADERAIGDTMLALTKALDKGRIGADVYIKQTRSLAREQFLKKALIKKIGSGMGLDAT